MATPLCQSNAEHTATWACGCSHPGNFCSPCILAHLAAPSGDRPHQVSPLGPVGQFTCGICNRRSGEAVMCRYPLCICRECVARLAVVGEVGEPREVGERQPNVSEAAAMQQEEGIRSELLSRLSAKRNQMNEELTRAMNNMNSFHDMAILALARLHDTEVQLEVCRKQLSERPMQQVAGGFDSTALDEIRFALKQVQDQSSKSQHDSLLKENQQLHQKVGALTERFQAAETELQMQQALREEIADLKKELASAEADKLETLRQKVAGLRDEDHRKAFSEKIDELSKDAEPGKTELKKKVTALKREVSAYSEEDVYQRLKRQMARTAKLAHSVVPLVHIDPDSLSPQSTDLFFQLAANGIKSSLKSANMRKIATGCLRTAKIIANSKDVSALATLVNDRMKTQPDSVLSFVNLLEGVVGGMKDEPAAKRAIGSLMKLGEKDKTFEECLLLLSRLRDKLEFAPLSDFAIALADHFLQNPSQRWKDCLLSLPLDWEAEVQAAANEVVKEYCRNLQEKKFREGYLLLGELLERLEPNEASLRFFATVSKGMKNDALAEDYQKLIEQVEKLRTSGKGSNITACALSLLGMLLCEDKTKNRELTQLRLILEAQTARKDKYLSVGKMLTDRLNAVQTPDTIYELGYSVLTWILPNSKPRDNLDFIEALLTAMESECDSEETAKKAIYLLTSIAQQSNNLIDICLQAILQRGISMELACEFNEYLSSEFLQSAVAGQLNTFLAILQQIMETEATAPQFLARTTELLANKQSEAALKVFQLYSVLNKWKVGDAAEFCFAFYVALGLASERDAAKRLISAFVDALLREERDYTTVMKTLFLWVKSAQRFPGDLKPFNCASSLLTDPRKSKDCLQALDEIIENGLYSSAFKLWDFSNRVAPQGEFLAEALAALKTIPKSAEAAINGLLVKVETKEMSDEEQVCYVKIGLEICSRKPGKADKSLGRLSEMLDKASVVKFVKALATVSFEHALIQTKIAYAHDNDSIAELQISLITFISAVERTGTEVAMPSKAMKTAIFQQPDNLKKVVDAANDVLAKSLGVVDWVVEIVFLVTGRSQEEVCALSYVPQLANSLLDLIDVNATNAVCRNLLASMSTDMAIFKKITTVKTEKLARRIADASKGQVGVRDLLRLVHEEVSRLANVRCDGIRLFNFEAKVWRPKVAIQGGQVMIDDGSCYTFLSENSIFCCGVGLQTYVFTRTGAGQPTEPWTLDTKADMITGRCYHGIICIAEKAAVYVFGGSNC